MKLFIGYTYREMKRTLGEAGVDFNFPRDVYLLTSTRDQTQRVMGMLPRAKDTFLVGDYMAGNYWYEIRDQVHYRLMRSGDSIEDCNIVL
jgi:hypothetical protein